MTIEVRKFSENIWWCFCDGRTTYECMARLCVSTLCGLWGFWLTFHGVSLSEAFCIPERDATLAQQETLCLLPHFVC